MEVVAVSTSTAVGTKVAVGTEVAAGMDLLEPLMVFTNLSMGLPSVFFYQNKNSLKFIKKFS